MARNPDKVTENRLRRMANRRGLVLEKSRRRDPGALGFGTYQLVHAKTNSIVYADHAYGFGKDLDEIEDYLTAGH